MTSKAWLKRAGSRRRRVIVNVTEPEEVALGILSHEKGLTPAEFMRNVIRQRGAKRLPDLFRRTTEVAVR
jgi:hypothetical protein